MFFQEAQSRPDDVACRALASSRNLFLDEAGEVVAETDGRVFAHVQRSGRKDTNFW